jgi:hypothetical protein
MAGNGRFVSVMDGIRRWTPIAAVGLWFAFVGWAIWRRVEISGQPLLFDAITYWLKAKNVWGNFSQGRWINPLDVEPTVRPPGTILMSYPFGFEDSPEGFLFRSVFLGIIMTAAAVFIVGRALPPSPARRSDLACVAFFLASLPMFYQFEQSTTLLAATYWGLVDGYLAGLASLAAASAILGAATGSWLWVLAASVLGSLCFLTKPAGALVIATVASCWLVLTLALWKVAGKILGSERPIWRRLVIGGLIFGVVNGPVIIAATRSLYFSSSNVAFGNRTLAVMKGAWLSFDLTQYEALIHTSIGGPFVVMVAIVVTAGPIWLGFRHGAIAREQKMLAIGSFLGSIIFVLAGAWFWLMETGGTQVRYFFPFALMTAIGLLPLSLVALEASPRMVRTAIRVLLLLPALNISILLAMPRPPESWQRMSGVVLNAAPASPGASLGQQLIAAVWEHGYGADLYVLPTGETAEAESLVEFERVKNPQLPAIRVRRPIDWQRPPAVRLAEVEDADFLLFSVVTDPADVARRLGINSVDSFEVELYLFEGWLSSLTEKDGVEVYAHTDKLRLLRVIDHRRLDAAVEDLKRSHHWRPTFLAANPQIWWSKDEITAHLAGRPDTSTGIDFGGLFVAEALSLDRRGENIEISLWWKPEKAVPPGGDWFFFSHLIDSAGAMLDSASFRLSDKSTGPSDHPYRFDSVTLTLLPGTAGRAIAFGIYQAEGGRANVLAADRGKRDWGNRRVLMPLPNG